MAGMILYLHGFCSSSQSWKARALAAALKTRGLQDRLICPDLPWEPAAAIALCERRIAQASVPITLVGSSLGGYYATFLAERHNLNAVLLNPAVVERIPPERWLGTHVRLHCPEETFELTSVHLDQLGALKTPKISPERYLLLVETGDEVLDYRDAVARYAGCAQVILSGGNHSFSRFQEQIPKILGFAGL